MKNLKMHMVYVNAFCFIGAVFVNLMSSNRLIFSAKYDVWLLYIIDIALPVTASISILHGIFAVQLSSASMDMANATTFLAWGTPIQIASSNRVLPLVGGLFAKSWVFGLACGILLTMSFLLCLAINITVFVEYTRSILSSRLQKAIAACIVTAFALFLLRSIWLSQGELNDYPFAMLSVLYTISSIPAIWTEMGP